MTFSDRKKIAVILNGISLKKKIFYNRFLPALQQFHEVEIFETKSKHDGISLASKAVEKNKYHIILAAGGDGTLHQVVNGVFTGREKDSKLPVIGQIPMGSGNDFAKSAKLKSDPNHLLKLIERFDPQKVNLGLITYTDDANQNQKRYFLNVSDIGMGPQVVKKVLDSGRAFGSTIAYYKSILSTFFTYKPMVVNATSADWKWSGATRSIAVSNGKYFAHGFCVAPDAQLNDNMLNVFIVEMFLCSILFDIQKP